MNPIKKNCLKSNNLQFQLFSGGITKSSMQRNVNSTFYTVQKYYFLFIYFIKLSVAFTLKSLGKVLQLLFVSLIHLVFII